MAVDRKRIEEALGGFAPPGASLDAAGVPPVPQANAAPPPASMAQEGIQEGIEGGPPVEGMPEPEAEGSFMPNNMTPEEQEQFKAMLALAARQRMAGI